MLHLRVNQRDAKPFEVSIGIGTTMGELRLAIWRMTGIPWSDWGQCQVLMLRDNPMPTDDDASVTASGLADGDIVQLVEDKSVLRDGYTARLLTG